VKTKEQLAKQIKHYQASRQHTLAKIKEYQEKKKKAKPD